MSECAPGVWRLGDRLVNWWLIVDGDAGVLVDAGLPGHRSQLDALLDRLHVRVEAVLATHGHIDHLGCISSIDAPAYVPRHDRPLAASKSKLDPAVIRHSLNPFGLRTALSYARNGAATARPVVDARDLDDGETLDLPGRPTFIETPGHTAGGGIFVCESRDVVFSGDVLVTLDPFSGRTGPRTLPAFDNIDHPRALEALSAVGATGAAHVLPGHGEPWHGSSAESAAHALTASR